MTGTVALLHKMMLQCAGDVGGGCCLSEYGLQRVVRGTVQGRSGKRNVVELRVTRCRTSTCRESGAHRKF